MRNDFVNGLLCRGLGDARRLHLDAARYFVPDSEVQGELAQAVDMASRAVAIEPKNVVALQALSAIQYHLGNFDGFRAHPAAGAGAQPE